MLSNQNKSAALIPQKVKERLNHSKLNDAKIELLKIEKLVQTFSRKGMTFRSEEEFSELLLAAENSPVISDETKAAVSAVYSFLKEMDENYVQPEI